MGATYLIYDKRFSFMEEDNRLQGIKWAINYKHVQPFNSFHVGLIFSQFLKVLFVEIEKDHDNDGNRSVRED